VFYGLAHSGSGLQRSAVITTHHVYRGDRRDSICFP
jgi:hypothetical protein